MALLVDEVDTLTNQIFSILENKFLFGYQTQTDQSPSPDGDGESLQLQLQHKHHQIMKSGEHYVSSAGAGGRGKVRILSIDSGSVSDGILAAQSLLRLQTFLRNHSRHPNAHIAHYFDVAAGSGAGGILAALLFTRGKDGAPLFTAEQALDFLTKNRRKLFPSRSRGIFRRMFRRSSEAEKLLGETFGEVTLKDTLKPVLIPCYDLSTHAPLLFSRADALEMDGYDFKTKDVCLATSADPTVVGAVEMRSVDGRTKLLGVEGGVAMSNPTAAAMTHVLNNKHEFPFCNGAEDLLVLSLGNGESESSSVNSGPAANRTPARFLKLAGEGASDMVDQAVAMAFGEYSGGNYARIQGNINYEYDHNYDYIPPKTKRKSELGSAEMEMEMEMEMMQKMLAQRSVEAVLFKGKRRSEVTNGEKIERMGAELIKEEERRRTALLPTVFFKQLLLCPSPRTSSASATTISTQSSSSSSI